MKTLLKVAAGLALALVLLVVVLYLSRNAIATAVVRAAAGRALGVPVAVESIELDLFAASATVRGLEVSNPKGYAAAHALKAGEIVVDLGAGTTASEVNVDLVALRTVGIWFEQRGTTNNVSDIIAGLSGGDAAAPAKAPAGGPSIAVTIDRLLLEKVAVHADVGTGKPVDVALDRLEVNDIRTNASGSGLAEQLTSKIFESVMVAVIRETGGQLPAAIGQGVLESARTAGTVIEGAAKAVGEAGKAVGDAFKGLGDVLGGGKKQ